VGSGLLQVAVTDKRPILFPPSIVTPISGWGIHPAGPWPGRPFSLVLGCTLAATRMQKK
jgi:hypothetical protein